MPLYRLLRNNKESGPYSLDDLVSLGLKPYDLVWVEGRSAAWRYPSEVSELKDFAPVVEEQPYDRFFKKPSEAKETVQAASQELSSQKSVVKEETVKQPVPETIHTDERFYPVQPNKKVFVSLPGKIETHQKQPSEPYQQYQPRIIQEEKPVEQNSYSTINIQESQESKLETKYTQSLDDIKDMYINTLVQRKTRNKRKELIKKYSKPVLASLFLISLGTLIGYFFIGKKTSLQANQSLVIAPEKKSGEVQDNKIVQPDSNQDKALQPADQNDPDAITQPTENQKVFDKEITDQSQKENRNPVNEKTNMGIKDLGSVQNNDLGKNSQVKIDKQNVEVDPNTGERKKAIRDENDLKNNSSLISTSTVDDKTDKYSLVPPKDLRKLVKVTSNNYVRGMFGGISDLQLTVFNSSSYLLDEVKVELQILKPSGQPLRTDVITFRNISANASLSVHAPDSQRGIKVDYRITNIQSQQWEKATAGL